MIFAQGCRQCMCCGPIMGNIMCVLGTDTVKRETDPGNQGNIVDSLNYYQGKGYACNSYLFPYTIGLVCGHAAIRIEEANDNGCVATYDDGECH